MRFAARVAVPCLLTAALLASAAVAQQNDAPPAALLYAISEASGAPFALHVVSRERFGSNAGAVELHSEQQWPRRLVRRCERALCAGTYYDGSRSFDTNINDTALPAPRKSDPFRASLDALASYAFLAPDFARLGGRLRYLPRGPFGVASLVVTGPGGVPLAVRLDANSLVSEARTLDGSHRINLRDYRTVGEARLPFEIDVDGALFETFSARIVVPEVLQRPAGLVATIPDGVSTTAMLRPDMPSTAPVIDCSMGGERLACLLDTGNSGMSMSLELAERLGIEPVDEPFGIRGIGSYVTGVVKAPPLHVGNATFPGAFYSILHDLRRYGYDLVIGTDAIAHERVTIDYPRRQVTFANAGADVSPEYALPLTFRQFLPIVSLGIGGTDIPVMLDTGDESTINLAFTYYQAHPDIFQTTSKGRASGVGGSAEVVSGEIPSARIGRFTIARPHISATRNLAPVGDGHAGSGLLAHFSITLDYTHERLELSPRPGDAAVSVR
ncbi:MAG: retroviral-like aspartic protease [Candidatus Eremiobacteraeota bacterium]|nr:retroviral-like aspartic protease [Candidatus Eremiobacteraeota bacterium]